jgi:hypothetical protein
MMDFAEAWSAFSIGDKVAVSDGLPPPSNPAGVAHRAWRSHNFTGRLVEKVDGGFRAMKFELDPEGGATIAYTVQEAVPHVFAAV